MGNNPQVRPASTVSLGSSGKGTHLACPVTAGSGAPRVQTGKAEEDSESSEESDSDGSVTPAKVKLSAPEPMWSANPKPFIPRSAVWVSCCCVYPSCGSPLISCVSFQAKPSGTRATPTLPQKVGPVASQVKVEKCKEESSGESTDSEEATPAASATAQVGKQRREAAWSA